MTTSTSTSTSYAVILPRFTGSLSAASSALIIFIIFQSRSKLSTIYHRIMFGMSCADIIGSIAMGLTTLPMPKQLPPDYEYISHSYKYIQGIRLGNMQTCAAQGSIFMFASFTMFAYNLSLCIYNTCFIGFRMRERTILKYVEPLLHLVPLAMGLMMALPPLVVNQYRPTGYHMWCVMHLSGKLSTYYGILGPLLLMIYFVIILLCGFAMIGRVYYIERQISRTRSSANHGRVTESLKNTKVLIFQVSAYFLSYVFTTLVIMLDHIPDIQNREILIVIGQSLLPLQGFFNALIFIYHKIYNYHQAHNDDVSTCYVLKLLLAGDSEEVMLFSRISMINYDQRRRLMEVELEDESGSVERISLEEDKASGAVDMYYDTNKDNTEQCLSGFFESSLSPVTKSSAPELEAAATSIMAKTEASNKSEHAGSLNGDSRLSMSKGSVGILSWMSRGSSSGISFASENKEDNA